jgi:hypothetical protein
MRVFPADPPTVRTCTQVLSVRPEVFFSNTPQVSPKFYNVLTSFTLFVLGFLEAWLCLVFPVFSV